jgi:elongation factor P hydroxylase
MMAEGDDAKIEEYRGLLERNYQLADEQRRCTNIIFSPGGYTKFEAFEAIARWDIAMKERQALIHRMAEIYILCPHLRHSFLRIFFDAKQKRDSYRDW